MYKLSNEALQGTLDATSQASKHYIAALYTMLQCLDMATEMGVSKAHGILNMIEQIERIQKALEDPAPSRQERIEAFKRSY